MRKALLVGLLMGVVVFCIPAAQAQEFSRERLQEISPGKVGAISTVTMTSANTQYSLTIPAGTKAITLVNNSGAEFRIAFETGAVATPTGNYAVIAAGNSYYEPRLHVLSATTIYCASSTAGTVQSLIYWY